MLQFALMACLLLGQVLFAQHQVFVPDASAIAGKVNIVPLGGKGPTGSFQNMRTQLFVPAKLLPSGGGELQDLAFAAANVGSYRYSKLQIRLAHLKGTTVKKRFADNLAGAVLVLDKGSHSYGFAKKDSWAWLGLGAKFVHDGKRDLVIDIVIQGAFFSGASPGSRRGDSEPRKLFALDYRLSSPKASGFGPYASGPKIALRFKSAGVVYFGKGCQGSNRKPLQLAVSATPRLGNAFRVQLRDALAKAPVLLLWGGGDKRFGGLSLPFDLGVMGAQGCKLYVELLALVALAADKQGALSQAIPVPNDPKLSGLKLYFQCCALDAKANLLGLSFSNATKLIVN
ncbi:MAG: hypothetical protein CSA62_12515 [Planctomycetota bacterium]|nr:MAG: hypothetical protein CSA62_12515 [Planctomycetota bacterium]